MHEWPLILFKLNWKSRNLCSCLAIQIEVLDSGGNIVDAAYIKECSCHDLLPLSIWFHSLKVTIYSREMYPLLFSMKLVITFEDPIFQAHIFMSSLRKSTILSMKGLKLSGVYYGKSISFIFDIGRIFANGITTHLLVTLRRLFLIFLISLSKWKGNPIYCAN